MLYTPVEILTELGKNIGKGMAGEIAVAQYFEKSPARRRRIVCLTVCTIG